MYIAVCDDQTEELDKLNSILNTWQKERGETLRIKTFRNAADLLDSAANECFSLYLLDVIMPGMNGIDAAREIRNFDTAADIVFLTSSPGFAYESYGVHALDYLLKPISSDRIYPILDKHMAQERGFRDTLIIKCGATLVSVPYSQLSFVEVMGKHLYFNLADGSVREVHGSLKEYEPLLVNRQEFMHVHRSYIVNMLQVSELSPSGIKTFSGHKIPVSRSLYPQLQKDYLKLMFQKKGE